MYGVSVIQPQLKELVNFNRMSSIEQKFALVMPAVTIGLFGYQCFEMRNGYLLA